MDFFEKLLIQHTTLAVTPIDANVKGATSRLVYLEKLSVNFSSLSLEIRVNLLHL